MIFGSTCILLIGTCIIVDVFGCEWRNEGEIVDCSKRGLLILEHFPKNVKQIRLQGNNIKELNLNAFEGLNSLEYLDLSNNNLTELPSHIFASIPQLKVLKLRKNRFDKVPSAIESFIGLDKLDLRNNQIRQLTEHDLQILTTIENVDLGKNLIENWPIKQIQVENNRLITLNLANNKLNSLEENQFSSLENLQSLKLAKNHIKNLNSNNFGGLDRLKHIDLSRNQLHTIAPLQFNTLTSLESLNLARNHLKDLQPGAFHGINSLLHLNLSSNRLNFESISYGGFYGLNDLNELDLSKNRLFTLSTQIWHYTPCLKKLWLGHNGIKQLIGSEFRLPHLESLSLASNKMESIQAGTFNSLTSLIELDLSDNQLAIFIEDKSILRNLSLPSVRRLDFSSNSLKILRSNSFDQFPALEYLDLRGNAINTMLADSFSGISLKELLISTDLLFCDCNLKWFVEWMFENAIDSSNIRVGCFGPPKLSGQSLMDISVDNLICSSDSPIVRLIKHPPPLVKVLVNTNAHLTCSGYGSKPLKLEWKVFKDGCAVELDKNDLKYQIFTNHTLNGSENGYIYGELKINDLTLEDSSDYQCSIKNTHGAIYSDPIHFVVQKSPEFIKIPKDIVAIEGNNVLLECAAQGTPDPIISWHKDNRQDFPAAIERRIHIKELEDGVYLLNVSKKDEGVYTCHATSDSGHISSAAKVEILDKVFKNKMEERVVYPHSKTTFDCSNWLLNSTIEWYWNEKIPLDKSKLNFQYADNDQLLTIYWSETLTNGRISCELYLNGNFLTKQSTNVFINSIMKIKDADAKVIRSPMEKREKIKILGAKQFSTNSTLFGILVGLFFGILIGVMAILIGCVIRCYCRRSGKETDSERPLNEKSSTL